MKYFDTLKTQAANATASTQDYFNNNEDGVKLRQGFTGFIRRAVRNKHVVNTLGAGLVGVLVSCLTFLPMNLCFTIGIILGAYKTLTSN